MPIHTDNCTGMGFDYQGDALSNNLGIRFRMFRTCLKAIQLKCFRSVSEKALWPFFDKPLGRFSTKILADFRPKFLVSFRPKPWPISDQKKIKLDGAHEPWRAPIRRDAGVRNLFREAFPIFTGSLPKFARDAFHFLPKTKIRIQKRPRFYGRKAAKEIRCRGAQIASPLALCATVAVFRHNFVVSFRPRFWSPNWKPKSENDQTEIGKRPGRNQKTATAIYRKC